MNSRQRRKAAAGAGATLASLALVGVVLLNASPAAAVDFANPAFQRVWNRTDYLVATGQVARTFFWGPEPGAAAREEYVDAPDGSNTRLVQYFDKSRMEINNPNADPNQVFYVTNGLLTIELISGQMQVGNNTFVTRYSANIPISGDIDDQQAPTYASFVGVSNTRLGDHPQPDRRGQFATATINKAGQVGNDASKANVPLAKIAYWESVTKHNIPEAFWNFLNATGPISDSGKIVTTRLIDPWFYASGLPISDPYWTKVKINGTVNVDVMIQAYERRVLTYVPTNAAGFQVEMGNIGQHYYGWRYKDAGKPSVTATPPVQASSTPPSGQATSTPPGGPGTVTPTVFGTATPTRTGTPATATPTPSPTPNVVTQGRIVFSSDRTGKRQIWRINGDGTNPVNLTASSSGSNNDYPAYSPDFTKIVFTSDRDNDEEIYVMNADGSGVQRLTNSPGRDYEPQWSPDGTKIVFVSERGSQPGDIFVMNANGTNPLNITQWPAADTDPSWSPNGRLVFTSRRSGSSQIYTINPDGSGVVGPLTSAGQNYLAKWNPRANRIVFVSDRDGGMQQIYNMKADGSEQTALTNVDAPNWDPSYAPDGSRIVFASARVSNDNLELYTMNADGSGQERITIQAGADNHPNWGISLTK